MKRRRNPDGASNGKRCLMDGWLRGLKSIGKVDELVHYELRYALLLAGASADALGGKMVMDSASNIERGSKMIISLRGKQRQALLGGYMVKGLKKHR